LRNILLARVNRVLQTPSFKKAVKKLHANQKSELDNAIKAIMEDLFIGELKKKVASYFYVFTSSRWLSSLLYLAIVTRIAL